MCSELLFSFCLSHNFKASAYFFSLIRSEMKLSSEEKAKYDTCMTACKQSATDLAYISDLISEKKYAEALKLCVPRISVIKVIITSAALS